MIRILRSTPLLTTSTYRLRPRLLRITSPLYSTDLDINRDMDLEIKNDAIQVTSHQTYQTPTSLSPSSVLPDPIDQFREWFTIVQKEGKVNEPEAMALSTTTKDGVPSVRIVLLKQVDARGFVFYTNYESRKSREISENSSAALALYWRETHQQVRVVGRVEKVSREDSESYYGSRPIGSRIGAWASRQSSVVGEEEVRKEVEKVEERFGVKESREGEVPCPEFWGGWRVVPQEIEFWCGRPSRLHDRVRYLREDDSTKWRIDRLAP